MANKSNRRIRLWKKFKNCFVCLKPISSLEDCTIEHIIPLSKGGTNKIHNLGISHSICNRARGNVVCRLVWELKMKRNKTISNLAIIAAWKRKIAERMIQH